MKVMNTEGKYENSKGSLHIPFSLYKETIKVTHTDKKYEKSKNLCKKTKKIHIYY